MSLLAPAFLLGLLAIGLPLWLHRLSSDNPNRKPFSSLMFLEPGEPQRVLARKLQYLLLLALRIALLVLIVLAFTQPTWWRSPAAAAGDTARLHVLLVDVSASMSFGNRFARARDQALEVIDEIGAAEPLQLLAGGRVTEVLTEPTLDRAIVRQRLATLEPGMFRGDYGQMMRAVEGLTRAAELPVVVHVITDAQRSAMPGRFAELAPRRAMEIRVHNVAVPGENNWAVESFGGSAVTGELEASIRSFADQSAQRTVALELNGRVVEERSVDVPAGGSAQVSFDPLTLASGVNRVRAFIRPADPLALDDQRFLALKRAEPRPVLLIQADQRGRGVLFLSSAMETLAALALTPDPGPPGAVTERTLSNYGFVIVTDAGSLGSAESARLAEYVRAGGVALISFGQRSTGLAQVPVTGQSFRVLGRPPTAEGGEQFMSVGMLDGSHPALRGLEDLRSARFYRYVAIDATADDRVLARLEDETPLIVEREMGAGRVLLFASSLDREWNDLPVQPVFVPFVANMANHMLGGAGFSSEAALGSTLAVRAMGLAGGQIFDPRGRAALGLGGGTNDALLDQIGFYEVVGGGRTELVAVNFDPRESDLTPMDQATLTRWEALGRQSDPAQARAGADQTSRIPWALGPWLLILLVLAGIMESWAGNWHLRVRRAL
jgi:hypothetical protein